MIASYAGPQQRTFSRCCVIVPTMIQHRDPNASYQQAVVVRARGCLPTTLNKSVSFQLSIPAAAAFVVRTEIMLVYIYSNN